MMRKEQTEMFAQAIKDEKNFPLIWEHGGKKLLDFKMRLLLASSMENNGLYLKPFPEPMHLRIPGEIIYNGLLDKFLIYPAKVVVSIKP